MRYTFNLVLVAPPPSAALKSSSIMSLLLLYFTFHLESNYLDGTAVLDIHLTTTKNNLFAGTYQKLSVYRKKKKRGRCLFVYPVIVLLDIVRHLGNSIFDPVVARGWVNGQVVRVNGGFA